MKLLTKEEADAHYRTTVQGGLKGFAVGLTAAIAGSLFLHRRWPYYHNLPLSLKAFGLVVVTIPATVIQAEHQSDVFQRQQWRGAGKMELDDEERRELERWDKMSYPQQWWDYAGRHQFGMVVGAWGLGMIAAGGVIFRNKYMPFTQKIVQVRMWAQGLTVASVIASAALFSTAPKGPKQIDHSWRTILAEEAQLEEIRKSAPGRMDSRRQVAMAPTSEAK